MSDIGTKNKCCNRCVYFKCATWLAPPEGFCFYKMYLKELKEGSYHINFFNSCDNFIQSIHEKFDVESDEYMKDYVFNKQVALHNHKPVIRRTMGYLTPTREMIAKTWEYKMNTK